jgi:hypothetical protein
MSTKQKMLSIATIVILLLTSCKTAATSATLDLWQGQYCFDEFFPPHYGRICNLEIQNEKNGYFAIISMDGWQTLTRLKASVQGSQDRIDIIFQEYLPENLFEPYEEGDVLFSLYWDEGVLYTEWEEMQPIDSNNVGEHIVCFQRTED